MSPARCGSGVFHGFLLAPLVLVLLAIFGLIFGGSDQARQKITEQLQYLIDPSGIKVIQDIAANAAKPQAGILATTIGVVLALFGASGVFGQLQEALKLLSLALELLGAVAIRLAQRYLKSWNSTLMVRLRNPPELQLSSAGLPIKAASKWYGSAQVATAITSWEEKLKNNMFIVR